MKSPNITKGREVKSTSGWLGGVNSVRHPWSSFPADQFKWGVNVSARGGIVQTRSGQAMQLSLPAGNFQGGILFSANKQAKAASTSISASGLTTDAATIYAPDGSEYVGSELNYIVFAVGGYVYYSPFPLTQPKSWEDYRLTGIQLDPTADEVVFNISTKSAIINTSGDITITPSYRIVVVQDGSSTPCFWDGSDKQGAQAVNMPIGKWMAFSGNRLWVASSNIVLASDLADPLSWTERTSGAGRGDFAFSRPITGMVTYVGQNNDTRLIVFTDRSTSSLASGILDRSVWGETANFQNTLYPTIGCIAGKSITFQAGLLYWYSQGGLISADVASASYLSSQILYKDVEMARVKRYMPSDVSRICSASFENYLLVSVPYQQTLNSATMVLDYAPAAESRATSRTPAWCGIWTGTRPVEWITGIIDGQQRIFHFSVDYVSTNDGSYNHLWESFMPERIDSFLQLNADGSTTRLYNRIYCQMETSQLGDSMDYKQFAYAELDASQIGGSVDLKISYRGSRGAYQNILSKRLLAVTDEYQYSGSEYEKEIKDLGVLNTQYRRIITEMAQTSLVKNCESDYTLDIDKAFSLLIEWCGELGIEAIQMYMDGWSESAIGVVGQNETRSCVVSTNGESITTSLIPSPLVDPTDSNALSWTATETRTITSECPVSSTSFNVSATATASFTSFISLENAKEQAAILATQAATAATNNYRKTNPC